MNRRGGVYSASSSKSFIPCKEEENQSNCYTTNDSRNTTKKGSSRTTLVQGSSCGDCFGGSDRDFHQSSSRSRMIRRRNGVILSSRKTKRVTQEIVLVEQEQDRDNRGGGVKSSSQHDEEGGGNTNHYTDDQKGTQIHDQRQKEGLFPFNTISSSIMTDRITRNHIIIDNETGFDSSHEGNQLFLDILHTYYSEMYKDVSSCITHRRLILNIVLDDMYSRGFQFIWRENGQYLKIHDNMVILKKIRKKLKETHPSAIS